DRIDYSGFQTLIDIQIKRGTNGLLLMGSTGEPTLLSPRERREIITRVMEYCKGRIPVFAGTTCGSTKDTIEFSQYAEKSGADGLVLVVPPYAGPSQSAVYEHFKMVAESVSIPLAVYNNPSRVGANIDAETIIKLSELPNVVADKEAMGNVGQLAEIRRNCNINVLCCDYPGYGLVIPTLGLGGAGTANISGNIIPAEMEQLSRPWKTIEDVERTRTLLFKYLPLMSALYSEPNPVPVKAALRLLGLPGGHVRRPLTEMPEAKMVRLKRIMEGLGVFEKYAVAAVH
ncbi:MAG TPA: 4-hydroxy-tetrahydrodipicolinate synthase, partial [Thermoleophilia bacterium]|nr:4-hydroxy-tetrahydrodipicolinate synthase [Thermoleophilia bacterium]